MTNVLLVRKMPKLRAGGSSCGERESPFKRCDRLSELIS